MGSTLAPNHNKLLKTECGSCGRAFNHDEMGRQIDPLCGTPLVERPHMV